MPTQVAPPLPAHAYGRHVPEPTASDLGPYGPGSCPHGPGIFHHTGRLGCTPSGSGAISPGSWGRGCAGPLGNPACVGALFPQGRLVVAGSVQAMCNLAWASGRDCYMAGLLSAPRVPPWAWCWGFVRLSGGSLRAMATGASSCQLCLAEAELVGCRTKVRSRRLDHPGGILNTYPDGG